jgi:hypothetical protein
MMQAPALRFLLAPEWRAIREGPLPKRNRKKVVSPEGEHLLHEQVLYMAVENALSQPAFILKKIDKTWPNQS